MVPQRPLTIQIGRKGPAAAAAGPFRPIWMVSSASESPALRSTVGSGVAVVCPPPTASTSASAGPDAAICDDSPAAADKAAAVQAAWGVLPQGLRTALSAKGLEPEGAHDGTAPAAVVSGLVGIHIDALLTASPLGGEGEKHVVRITADVYVGLVNKDRRSPPARGPPV